MKNPFPLPDDLTIPEKELIAKAKSGEWCWPDRKRPAKEDRDAGRNEIRAMVIMHLALGGDDDQPVHPQGVMLSGAWIAGELNFDSCTLPRPLWLEQCYIEAPPVFLGARTRTISLSGSWAPSLNMDGLTTEGPVFLRDGFEAAGPVFLRSAKIGGQLACSGGKFRGEETALNADSLTTEGPVFLRDGFEAAGPVILRGAKIGGQLSCIGGKFRGEETALDADGLTTEGPVFLRDGFEAAGPVILRGAKIGGQLSCIGGKFRGEKTALNADNLTTEGPVFLRDGFEAAGPVILRGAKIGGQLSCSGGKFLGGEVALNLEKARVEGDFFWRAVTLSGGTVNLAGARVEDVEHDIRSWPESGKLYLGGFVYDGFGASPAGFAVLKDWLKLQPAQHLGVNFRPQPFEQLAKVLRETGHTEDAKRVAIMKQVKQRAAELRQSRRAFALAYARRRKSIDPDEIERLDRELKLRDWNWLLRHTRWIGSRFFGLVVGYGYRPIYAVGWAAAFVVAGTLIFGAARDAGSMVPNNPILLKTEWAYALEGKVVKLGEDRLMVRDCIRAAPYDCFHQSVPDFQPFQPLVYAIDTFVPLVDLHQEPNWIPQVEGKPGSPWTRLYLWLHIAVGWIVTAVFAASVTGMVKKDV